MPTAITVSTQRGITGNMLKLIAAVSMLIDHMGVIFFPQSAIFRVIGRLAFPIFAFMIAEGCFYTKNRLRYFLGIFLLGAGCQLVYFFVSGDTYLNILLTFSCAIPIIYLLQEWKSRKNHWLLPVVAVAVGAAYVLNRKVELDYGFWGMMVPVFTALAYPGRGEKLEKRHHLLRVFLLAFALLPSCLAYPQIRFYSYCAVLLLLFYSGKRGKGNFKYAFYLFYPLHLALLQGIAWLLTM